MRSLRLAALVGMMAAALGCKAKEDAAAPADDLGAVAVPASAREPEGVLIPRSMADKGRYYLLAKVEKDGVITAVHKRVGVDSVVWTRTQTNCRKKRMREMGYSEEGRDKIVHDPTKWFELVEGSSKSDLFHFLCDR